MARKEGNIKSNREFELTVKEANQRDIGRSVLRLDKEMFRLLDVRTGSIIKIQGKEKVTAGVVWPAYLEDEGQKIIRIDERIRRNAGVSIDEKVRVSRVKEQMARQLFIAPTDIIIRPSDPYVESFIKKKLLNFPLNSGDIIYIPIGIRREVQFQVVSTEPDGIVVVKHATKLKLRGKPVGQQGLTIEDTISDIQSCSEDLMDTQKNLLKISKDGKGIDEETRGSIKNVSTKLRAQVEELRKILSDTKDKKKKEG